jgi:hypothetical protein
VHRVLQIADAQAAFVAAAEPARQRFQPVGMGQQGPRLGQEGTAIGGQPDALLRAFEQLQSSRSSSWAICRLSGDWEM